MLRVPNPVKNYTAGCANYQKLYYWVHYFYREEFTFKIIETACASMLFLKINYNLGENYTARSSIFF